MLSIPELYVNIVYCQPMIFNLIEVWLMAPNKSGCGGIGIRARLRGVWLCLASSSLAIRIPKILKHSGVKQMASYFFLRCFFGFADKTLKLQIRAVMAVPQMLDALLYNLCLAQFLIISTLPSSAYLFSVLGCNIFPSYKSRRNNPVLVMMRVNLSDGTTLTPKRGVSGWPIRPLKVSEWPTATYKKF